MECVLYAMDVVNYEVYRICLVISYLEIENENSELCFLCRVKGIGKEWSDKCHKTRTNPIPT